MAGASIPPPPDRALAARVQALAAKLRRGGRLDAEDLAELQALGQLQQLLAHQAPQPKAARWPLALALVAALALASALMSLRTPGTPIELDAEVSALRFELAQAQAITGTLPLAGLRAIGLQSEEGGSAGPPVVFGARNAADAACRPTLTLEPLFLPAGARVALRASPQDARLRLTLHAPGAMLQLSVGPCAAARQPRQARSLSLRLGADEVDLELEAAAGPLALAPVIAAQGLALDEIETLAGDGATHVRRASTLRAGRLHLLALDNRTLELRRGELLTLGGARGELRELEAAAGLLKLRFAGEVTTLTKGEGGQARNLLPTLLEWLRANQALALVWAGGLTLFSLGNALTRWWRNGETPA